MIESEQHKALRLIAFNERRSVADLVREGIAEVVLASPATTDPAIYGIRARRLYFDDLKDPRRLRADSTSGRWSCSRSRVRARLSRSSFWTSLARAI